MPSPELTEVCPGRVRSFARRVVLGAVVIGTAGLVGCTGSSEPAPTDSGAVVPNTPSASSAAVTASPSSRPDLKALPSGEAVGIAYADAAEETVQRFAPVDTATGGLSKRSAVRSVSVDGDEVAAVATYVMSSGAPTGARFHDQYLNQLIGSVSDPAAPRTWATVDGRALGLIDGTVPVAGWFEGDRAVIVMGVDSSSAPDLADLAAAVLRAPEGR